jgi:hypothetical protein
MSEEEHRVKINAERNRLLYIEDYLKKSQYCRHRSTATELNIRLENCFHKNCLA